MSLQKYTLSIVVFLTGAAVLVVEVCAVRILAPYFGNTIYTMSSVLGVILAALSAGYYLGGKLADRYPSANIFFSLILAGGLTVYLLQWLVTLLPDWSVKLNLVTGPLWAALGLFFLPSFLLGMLSPFAVKLQYDRGAGAGVGATSGNVFFWSTIGSISGSLVTGFYLIPHFRISDIMLATGLGLSLLGLIPLLWRGAVRTFGRLLILILLIAGAPLAIFYPQPLPPSVVYAQDGVYERIVISDGWHNGQPARFLEQDRSLSAARYLESDELVYDYTKYYKLYQLLKPDARQVLAIGGGAYSVPAAMWRELPQARIDVVEIEPELYELAVRFFNAPVDPRFQNHVADGRRWLARSDKQYDVIFSDVYRSLYSVPWHFTTQEFFQLAKERLSTDGVFMANIIGTLSRTQPSLIMSEIRTFRQVFPNSYFFAVSSPKFSGTQNIMFVGVNGQNQVDWPAELQSQLIDPDRFELSAYPILTDDYAPVDELTAKVLRQQSDQNFFNGQEMMALIAQQLRYGPRYPGAAGHRQIQNFLIAELQTMAPDVSVQSWSDYQNIIARFNPERPERIMIATHYDTKKYADRDPRTPRAPLPGANDGGSGVAVLLELGRALGSGMNLTNYGIDLVFFDGEEGDEEMFQNNVKWQPLGATYFSEHLADLYGQNPPRLAIIVDMVGDRDLLIQPEPSSLASAPDQVKTFFNLAEKLEPAHFSSAVGPEIGDDHTPLMAAGIPSLLIIDINYPAWHTAADDLDAVSPDSLETVSQVLWQYLESLDRGLGYFSAKYSGTLKLL